MGLHTFGYSRLRRMMRLDFPFTVRKRLSGLTILLLSLARCRVRCALKQSQCVSPSVARGAVLIDLLDELSVFLPGGEKRRVAVSHAVTTPPGHVFLETVIPCAHSRRTNSLINQFWHRFRRHYQRGPNNGDDDATARNERTDRSFAKDWSPFHKTVDDSSLFARLQIRMQQVHTSQLF